MFVLGAADMAITKSRRAPATKTDRIDEWELLARDLGISDFDAFIEEQDGVIRRAATNYRDRYGPSQVCSYDQATHSMLLCQIGVGAGFTSVLRSAVVRLLGRVSNLEQQLKAAKSLQTKALDTRFSLDDLEVEQVDDRNIKIALVRGDDEAAFTLKFPVVVDRGVWSDRGLYERGDGVSHAGSWWVAKADNPGKPGCGDGWRLAVKRGADAKAPRKT